VISEAIVNAVCHRDYRLKGRRIEIRMYSDRLEVISPGGLPGFITVENIKEEHFSRNPRIVNGLFQWGYIEELGLGIDRMMEVMEKAGHKPPIFDARPYSFAVTLFNQRQQQENKPTTQVAELACFGCLLSDGCHCESRLTKIRQPSRQLLQWQLWHPLLHQCQSI
jgi:predicted HTH transcriptional regulator